MMNRLTILGSMLLLLTACSGGKEHEKRKSCPDSLILSALSKDVRESKAKGRTDIDLASLYPKCNCNSKSVEVDPYPVFTAVRSNSNSSDKISTDYFIALIDEQDQILIKKTYRIAFDFSAGEQRKQEHQSSPLSYQLNESQKPEDLKIYVGFQLSPEQYSKHAARYEKFPLLARG